MTTVFYLSFTAALKRHGQLLKSFPLKAKIVENVNLTYTIPDASPRKEEKAPRISSPNRWKGFEDFSFAQGCGFRRAPA
jgi:hypothetical protein